MIKNEQLLSLVHAHINHDNARFREILMQISAEEANKGNKIASEKIESVLKEIPEKDKITFNLKMLNSDASDFLVENEKHYKLDDLIVNDKISRVIQRIIKEYNNKDRLHEYNLQNSRKIMLYGPPGTGKTMTAEIIANELKLPFITVQTEKLLSKFLGETGLKLSKVFDVIFRFPGVYLFDEFDSICCQRGTEHDVGEQRRIVDTFLQLLDRDKSESIIVAATNDVKSIDNALFRRFDEEIEYELPQPEQIAALFNKLYLYDSSIKMSNGKARDLLHEWTVRFGKSQSPAEIKHMVNNILKNAVIDANMDAVTGGKMTPIIENILQDFLH